MEGICPRTGKQMFTRREDIDQAKWWRHHRHARMAHYSCKACGRWHIGNRTGKPRRRRR